MARFAVGGTTSAVRCSFMLVSLAVACACGGGGGGGGGGGEGPRSVGGVVTYDLVPARYDPSTYMGGLDFPGATRKPVRGATVQVMKGAAVLAATTTDAAGRYSLSFTVPSGSGSLSVVALAESADPVIQVVDNTDGKAIWAVVAPLGASATTVNLHAAHGWTGSGYDAQRRAAAPFAILDAMVTAARAFLTVRTFTYPDLVVNWSPNNTSSLGNQALGQIGTSHYDPEDNQIYILGKEGVDTDEFDSHVIVHEWGHYFENNFSRSDSLGGPHSAGDVLDPRVAFGEGFGDALPAMLLPETLYADTLWDGGDIVAFGFDAEAEPVPTDDERPGPFSEASVMRLLYDLFDSGPGEGFDTVGVGLGAIYDVLTGPQRNTPALTTIGSFVAGLKDQPGTTASTAAIDGLLAHYQIGPIADEWGTGDAGLAAMYTYVPSFPDARAVYLGGGFEWNTWYQNQYYVFEGNGSAVTVSASSTQDTALIVYQAGDQVVWADANTSGTETVHVPTVAGRAYVVNLVGFGATPGEYGVDMQFTSP